MKSAKSHRNFEASIPFPCQDLIDRIRLHLEECLANEWAYIPLKFFLPVTPRIDATASFPPIIKQTKKSPLEDTVYELALRAEASDDTKYNSLAKYSYTHCKMGLVAEEGCSICFHINTLENI